MPCAYCATPFTPVRRTQRFCSSACCEADKLVAVPARVCEDCGVEFQPRLRTQRFCSGPCYRRGYNREHPAYVAHHREVSNAARMNKGVVTAAIRAELVLWPEDSVARTALRHLIARLDLFDRRRPPVPRRRVALPAGERLERKPRPAPTPAAAAVETTTTETARCPKCFKPSPAIGIEHHRPLFRCDHCGVTFYARIASGL